MVIRVDASSEATLQAFANYQLQERGLAERTVYNATFVVRAFLAWREAETSATLAELRPEELGGFIVHEAQRLRRRGMPTVVSTVRSYVRFLFATGVIERDLSGSIPPVKVSRFGALPVGVEPAALDALLASCDRASTTGRRDYAVLVLMSRLGLRAIEIARLCLEDIDWRGAGLVVRGKGGRHGRLPLPHDVGEALADYLRHGRPPTTSRAVFLSARPPFEAMSRNAVVFVPRSASERAGIPVVGGHRLRHHLGTGLLARGASLRDVGELLRHDVTTTSAIYAKVDVERLSLVVRPFPGTSTR
jgi:site-specific recombinase XerD